MSERNDSSDIQASPVVEGDSEDLKESPQPTTIDIHSCEEHDGITIDVYALLEITSRA